MTRRCRISNNIFALKGLSKGCGGTLSLKVPGFLVQRQQEQSVLNEKKVLRMTQSPFIIRLAATFNGATRLFLYGSKVLQNARQNRRSFTSSWSQLLSVFGPGKPRPALGGDLFTAAVERARGDMSLRFISGTICMALWSTRGSMPVSKS